MMHENTKKTVALCARDFERKRRFFTMSLCLLQNLSKLADYELQLDVVFIVAFKRDTGNVGWSFAVRCCVAGSVPCSQARLDEFSFSIYNSIRRFQRQCRVCLSLFAFDCNLGVVDVAAAE